MPSHYLNQCWNIVNWTPRNKLQWNINENSNIFIQNNAFENAVCKMTAILSWPQCDNTFMAYVDGLVQDCSNSIANALELLQSCTKPSMWFLMCVCWSVRDLTWLCICSVWWMLWSVNCRQRQSPAWLWHPNYIQLILMSWVMSEWETVCSTSHPTEDTDKCSRHLNFMFSVYIW